MLSRMSWKKGSLLHFLKCKDQFKIPLRSTTASINIPKEQSSERDLINFPKRKRLEYTAETRLLMPKSWFDAFYNKTGVTGPYMLFGGITTYVLSKEYIVMTHEVVSVFSFVLILPFYSYLLKEKVLPILEKKHQLIKEELDAPNKEYIDSLEQSIQRNNSKKQEMEGIISYLPNAKRENVYLQMEAAYRAQLQEAYKKVKSRLDFHVEKENIERRIAQKNMIDWILRHVMESITPQHMNNALKQSIADIKTLAAKT